MVVFIKDCHLLLWYDAINLLQQLKSIIFCPNLDLNIGDRLATLMYIIIIKCGNYRD